MQVNTGEKILYLKLVYYGPGLSGKTTNLESIHRLTDPEQRQPLVSLRTEQDRTLFFDLLPFDLGTLFGMQVRLKLYTVPGQIQYDTTRKQVLAGADGVVFVADSSAAQRAENARMIKYLKNNLEANGLDFDTIPLLMQWNKRDLPDAMPVAEMERELNVRGAPSFEAIATEGVGVMESFREITALTVEALAGRGGGVGRPEDIGAVRSKLDALFGPRIARDAARALGDGIVRRGTVHDQAALNRAAGRERAVLGLDELLSQAVQANLEIADQLARPDDNAARVERARRERRALARLLEALPGARDGAAIVGHALEALLSALDRTVGSAVAPQGSGQPFREIEVAGRDRDPLNAIVSPGVGSACLAITSRGLEPYVCHDIRGEILFGQDHASTCGLAGVLAVPIVHEGRPVAFLLAYDDGSDRSLDDDDVEFARIVSAIAALALRGVVARAGAGA